MSDRERDREGGGLAVVILAGFLVVSLLLIGSGATYFVFVRQLERERFERALVLQQQAQYELEKAKASQAAAEAAVKAAEAAIETPAPSAAETR